MTFMALLTSSLWKATLLLAAAFGVSALLRRCSASVRHFVWTAAFSALILLPVAILLEPQWTAVSVPQSVVLVTEAQPAPDSTPAAPARPIVPMVWAAGCIAIALRFAIGAARTSWIVRRGSNAHIDVPEPAGKGVRLVYSRQTQMPLAWGIVRPVVVLPVEATDWPEGRLATVVLHEMMHIRRRDLLAQLTAQLACSLYWFHPLAWLGFSRMRQERERACDDAVLRHGIAAHDYAGHLVDLVRTLRSKRSGWAGAPAMADASDFESRVRALLDRGRNRRPLTRAGAVAIAGVVMAVLLPMAAITGRAQADRGAIAGVVEDPSGARVAQCRIVIKNLDSGAQQSAGVSPAGEYQFTAIPAGRYSIDFSAPGFRIMQKAELVVNSGQATRFDAHLAIGSVNEAVTVRAQRPGTPAVPAIASGPQKIRIGGMVQALRLVQQTRPVYPPDLQAQGLEGTVQMAAVVSKDGRVHSVRVTKSAGAAFDEAALNAVKQWVYTPMLLNGEPVECLTNIDIQFQLDQ